MHTHRTGPTSLGALFGGKITTSRSDEAAAHTYSYRITIRSSAYLMCIMHLHIRSIEGDGDIGGRVGWRPREKLSDPQDMRSRCTSPHGIRCSRSLLEPRRRTRHHRRQRSGQRCRSPIVIILSHTNFCFMVDVYHRRHGSMDG